MKENEELNPTEKNEAAEDSGVVVKDGELFIRMEDESNDPETDPPKEGESEEDNQNDQGTANKEPVDGNTDLSDPYAGKSTEDVIAMHKDASRKISEQGNEISQLKASDKATEPSRDEDLTSEELIAKMSSKQIGEVVANEKMKLKKMDPTLDEESYFEQQFMVNDLEQDFLTKRQDEKFEDRFNHEGNEKFLAKAKDNFKELGIDMSDEEFDSVAKVAKIYSQNGKLDDTSMQKALIDEVGVEKMTKFYAMNGEAKAREDISKAAGKMENKIDVRGSGKNAKLVNLHTLSDNERRKAIGKLSIQELDELYNKLDT